MRTNDKKYYLTINGKKVYVTEDVYREYKKPLRRERKRRQRMMKCRCEGGARCTRRCEECEYYLGGGETGSILSLDGLRDSGAPEPADPVDVEEAVIYSTVLKELFEALDEYMPGGRHIAEMLAAEETQKDIAAALGIPVQTLQYRIKKIRSFCKQFLDM